MTRAELLAKIAVKQAQLDAANASLLELLGEKSKEFEIDSPEGSHRVIKRNLSELNKMIKDLEYEIEFLSKQLYRGAGIARLGVGL